MIKKLIYGFAIVAGLTACNDDYSDWASPQTNPQEEILAGELDMPQLEDVLYANLAEDALDATPIKLYTPSAEYESYEVYCCREGKKVAVTPDENGCIAASELKNVVEELYGRAPYERTIDLEVYGLFHVGQQLAKAKGQGQIKVTLVAPYISEHYYIVGAPSAWDPMETSLPLTRNSDADLYEDPVFTVTFPVSAGDTWFAIADDKTHDIADWSGLLGCAEGNGNNGMEGGIARRTELGNDGSWMFHADQDCFLKVTLNMMDYTYKLEAMLFQPYAYLPGSANDWGFGKDILLGNDNGLYEGYAVLGGEWGWKVTQYPDWNHGDYGNGGEGLLQQGGGNIMEGTEGKQYRVKVDLANLTYELLEITSWSLIGSVKGNWDTDVDLTPDLPNRCWSVTADLNEGEFKIRANHDWAWSLGGSFDSMTDQNGSNMKIDAAGNYTITFYPSYNGASHCTVVKN